MAKPLYSFDGMTGETVIYSQNEGDELYRTHFHGEDDMAKAAALNEAFRKAERLSAIHTAKRIQGGMFGVIDSAINF